MFPALLLWIPAVRAAEERPAVRPAPKAKVSAVSLLPDGSRLHGVMFPRYDEQLRLMGVLRARTMTLVNDHTVAGQTISIEFFHADQSLRGRVDLTRAVFDQVAGMIEAREAVTLRSDRLNANGTALYYAMEAGEGFLAGPAATWIQNPTEITMKSRLTPRRAAGIVGLSLVSQTPAAAPVPPDAAATAALQADAASKAGQAAAAGRETRAELAAALDASTAATTAARAFLEQAGLAAASSAGAPPEPPAAKPLDLKPGPNDTVILSDGGMYFDPDEGVFVYLKNVRVTDPRFTMSGANELKVFLGEKTQPADGAATKPDKDKASPAARFGEVERIVATGAIVIDSKAARDKEPIKASGAIFSYNLKTDQVIISGGYPWVVQGGIALRAKQPSLTLRIQPKAGRFDTEGEWETILPLDRLQNQKTSR